MPIDSPNPGPEPDPSVFHWQCPRIPIQRHTNPSKPFVHHSFRSSLIKPHGYPPGSAIAYQMKQNIQYQQQSGHFGDPGAFFSNGQQYGSSQFNQAPGGNYSMYCSHYYYDWARPDVMPIVEYPQFPVQYYFYQGSCHQPGSFAAYSLPEGTVPSGIRGNNHGIGSCQLPEWRDTRLPASNGSLMLEAASLKDSVISPTPCGPPRKPKRSDHALWVGNLPPKASIVELKDHFSRDAKKDIESIFLISKSHCAFVNYRTAAACEKAVIQFHNSRFQHLQLVCRRRICSSSESDGNFSNSASEPSTERNPSSAEASERYFIIKSLTLQDLEQSVRNGMWSTQPHNESLLNAAYNSGKKVFLIFSANKSGAYFGYAQMASSIAENAMEVYDTIPRTHITEYAGALKTIRTPETEFAPEGHIINDTARSIIFWEAENANVDLLEEALSEANECVETGPQTWSRLFKVEWISTTRLPFYRTRGLRNPWNANNEVKIARDGTELEPNIGRHLIQLFHCSDANDYIHHNSANAQHFSHNIL